MQNLPYAETYEKEFTYMSWGKLISEIIELAKKEIPQGGEVLDVLCGPGYLVGKIKGVRHDLNLTGVDLEQEYIDYAQKKYPGNVFLVGDAFSWQPLKKYDAIFCTGGLHHLPYEKQALFIERLSSMVKKDGFVVVGDPYIDDYVNEKQRKIGGAKLGYEYLAETIRNGAPNDVVVAAVDLIRNDVLAVEFKTSIVKVKPYFEKNFSEVVLHKTWPADESGYGDYYFVLRK